MKRFWLLAAGVLLLWLDIYVVTGPEYPTYVPDENYGRVMQDLVMGRVVGTSMKVDVVPDILGYALLMLVGGGAVWKNRRYAYGVLAGVCGIVAEVLCMTVPFFANGAAAYAAEYFLHMGGYLLELAAIFFVVQAYAQELDNVAMHRMVITGVILMMLSLLCGLAQNVGYFYNVTAVPMAYTVVRGIVNAVFLGCLYQVARYGEREVEAV